MWTLLLSLLIVGAPASAADAGPAPVGMSRVGGGAYRPLYRAANGEVVTVRIAPFWLDRTAVTNAEYLTFVRANPEWRRSRVRRLFAAPGYLQHWAGDLALGRSVHPRQPVVHVSWFAAQAYARWRGRRLPTVAEWEVAAQAGRHGPDARREPDALRRIRDAYGRPRPAMLPLVGQGPANYWGLRDLHGLVFEWTSDFNGAFQTADSRRSGDADAGAFCGAGAVGAGDTEDYAAFLRYGYRATLQARSAVSNLGFRTAAAAR